mgnify:CR=1 FL=1
MADPVTWSQVLKWGIPTVATLLGGLFGGDGGASKEAAASQAALNKELLNIFREQQKMENPFRRRLLQQLTARSNQQFPKTSLPTPRQMTFNPLAASRRLAVPAAFREPGQRSGGETRRQRGSFLTERTPSRTKNPTSFTRQAGG